MRRPTLFHLAALQLYALSIHPITTCALSSPISSSKARVFVVTGATDGIGRHTAEKLASDGHGLIVHGRRSTSDIGADLCNDLSNRGASFAHYIQADLSDLNQVENLATEIHNVVDHIDVLINNAGVFDPSPTVSKQNHDMTWAVNVMAPFLLTRHLLPLIAKGDSPRIITTSSISQSYQLPSFDKLFAGDNGEPVERNSGHSSYSWSKLGDAMFTAKLASILSSQANKRLSCIKCLTMDPGTVNTKMLLAGWGACGIPVKKANNTYKLAATDYGAQQPSGSYHFGGSVGRDAKNPDTLDTFWRAMEEQTGCSYANLDDYAL